MILVQKYNYLFKLIQWFKSSQICKRSSSVRLEHHNSIFFVCFFWDKVLQWPHPPPKSFGASPVWEGEEPPPLLPPFARAKVSNDNSYFERRLWLKI